MDWIYAYRELTHSCDENHLAKTSSKITELYTNHLIKKWSIDLNSEWVCRHYLASKMILNATVILNTLNFSEEIGMRLATPYFKYYAVLSLARAVVYTIPTEAWNEGKLITINHSRAIDISFEWLKRFNSQHAQDLKKDVLELKAQRELISYRAPSMGDANLQKNNNLEYLLTILAELAQFNSELLAKSLSKHTNKETRVVDDSYFLDLINVKINNFTFSDKFDAQRLNYLQRKMPFPVPLLFTMTEGMTEDFIYSWDGDEEQLFSIDSPRDWQAIFDIP